MRHDASELTPKFDAANLSLAETAVVAAVWAQKAFMLARSVLMSAGTPAHIYLHERQEKCLQNQLFTVDQCNTKAFCR